MNRPPPTTESKSGKLFGVVFLLLFSLPFAGFGLIAVYQGIHKLSGGNTKEGLIATGMGLIFSSIGFGFLLALFFGSRLKKRADAIKLAHPEEPWLWRKDWATGLIKSSGKSNLIFAWVFALFWNAISSGVFLGIADHKKQHGPGLYIALIFPLIGLGLLIWAIRLTLQRLKFGESTFKMLSLPGVIGGSLNGAIETSVKLKPEDGFHLKLRCVNRVTTGSGKQSSTTESIIWEDEKTLVKELLDDDPRRSGIPVYFKIPRSARESDDTNSNNRIVWRLEARVKVPGIDYLAQFEVPVFETADSAADTEPAVDPTAAYEVPRAAYQLPAELRIIVRPFSAGGTEFYFPPARNLGTLFGLTAFLLLWTAVVAAIFLMAKSTFFEVVFTLVDVLLAFAWFNLCFKSSRITISTATVRIITHWLFLGPTRKFDAQDVAGFQTKTGMTSGQTVFYNLQLRTNGGLTTTIASNIPGKTEAEWLCAEMERSLNRA